MAEHGQAEEARRGLLDSVKGKAKELLGAVTGNDSLTAEGHLEQTQARERRAANSVAALADAQAEQARAQLTETMVHGAAERIEVHARTVVVEDSVRAERDARKRAAEQDGARDVVADSVQADMDAQRAIHQVTAEQTEDLSAVTADLADAVDERRAVEHIVTNAHQEADRIRARAEALTDDAGLS